MSPRGRSALLAALVFALGGVTGAAASRAWTFRELRGSFGRPPPEARARFRLEALRRHLDLTEAQALSVEAIFRETEVERDRAMEACRPALDALRARTDERLDGVLTPEQREKMAEVRRNHPGPPPFDGPPHPRPR